MCGTVSFRDSFTVERLSSDIALLKEALRNWDEVVVDISDVCMIDCAALQMLAAAQKECLEKGAVMTIKKGDIASEAMACVGIRL